MDALTIATPAFRVWNSWTPKVCRVIVFLAAFKCFGLLFYILLGFGIYG